MTDRSIHSGAEHRSPAGSHPITADRYLRPDVLAAEWAKLWPRAWLVAGLACDVREPGDYFVFTVGPESILVSHSDDGTIGAFYNVCQHRGARVMVNDRGWVKNFVCPYHGWTYDRSGALSVVPDADRFTPPIDCEARSLQPVRVEVWAGLVWICMDPETPGLADYLGPVKEQIDAYRPQDMALIEDQTVDLECNWKAVFDNFGELYHVEHIHPQHATIFDCPSADLGLWKYGHTSVYIEGTTVNRRLPIPDEPTPALRRQLRTFRMDPAEYHGRVLDAREDIQKVRREVGPGLGYDYDLLSDEQLSDIVQHNFFPNTMITIQPEDMLIMRARPHPTDPSKCYWDKWTFRMAPSADVASRAGVAYEPNEGTAAPEDRPVRDVFTQEQIIDGSRTMTITIDQDIHLIRDVQNGMRSRGFDTALLNDDEARVQHYHDWYAWWMDGSD